MESNLKRPSKPVSASRSEQVHIIMPMHANSAYTLFGGMLMQWIDVTAGVVARRHCEHEIRTVAIDHLEFLAPAYINDTLTLVGQVTYVGNTSMEICVDSFVEKLGHSQERKLVNRAYLTMVAIDDAGKPIQVPELICETEEERANFEAGKQRRALRKQHTSKAQHSLI